MIKLPSENLDEILGSLLKEPSILKNPKYKFDVNEFQENHHKIIFSCIYNMHKNGMTDEISSHQFMDYLRNFNIDWYNMYTSIDANGIYLERISTGASVKNFEYHYNRLKKFILLRELQLGGWDISRVIDISNENTELNMEFELKTTEELLESLFVFNHKLKKKWCSDLDDDSKMTSSNEGIRDLISTFQQGQVFGVKLSNSILNSIFKGARFGKVVLDGQAQGVGKTRTAVMNACNMALPFKYVSKTKSWVSNGLDEKVLVISTELLKEEIQTMMLAHCSKIQENRLNYFFNELTEEEISRLEKATTLLENYPVHICHLPNYNLTDLEIIIEEYVLKYGVRYVYFDYIHMTGKIMEQLKGAREDLIILQIMTAIKNICTKYQVFFWVGSQLNRGANQSENQDSFAVFRSAFSIGDKVDGGVVTTKVIPQEVDKLFEALGKLGGFRDFKKPNLIRTVVKNRGGQNSIRIWVNFNHGTLEEEVVAVTDLENNPITVDIIEQDEGTIENYQVYLDWLNS